MKTQLFSQASYTNNFFALHSHYSGDTPYRVSLDLDKSLTRWKRPIFEIPFSQDSKSFVWKPNFFRMQAIQKLLFALHFHYTGDTPCRVWLDLDNSLTRWQRPISKIPFLQNSKSSVWTFLLGKLYQKYFLHYTVIILLILNAEFGLIWKTPWPDEKELFLKFAIREIRKISYENPTFFRGKLYQFFCFTLSLHWWYSILRLVWFEQLLNPMKKTFFKNSFFAKFKKLRMTY